MLPEHLYPPLPASATSEDIRVFTDREMLEMEAFRDELRARRISSARRATAGRCASALALLLILALLVVGFHALAHFLIGTPCPIMELLN